MVVALLLAAWKQNIKPGLFAFLRGDLGEFPLVVLVFLLVLVLND